MLKTCFIYKNITSIQGGCHAFNAPPTRRYSLVWASTQFLDVSILAPESAIWKLHYKQQESRIILRKEDGGKYHSIQIFVVALKCYYFVSNKKSKLSWVKLNF